VGIDLEVDFARGDVGALDVERPAKALEPADVFPFVLGADPLDLGVLRRKCLAAGRGRSAGCGGRWTVAFRRRRRRGRLRLALYATADYERDQANHQAVQTSIHGPLLGME